MVEYVRFAKHALTAVEQRELAAVDPLASDLRTYLETSVEDIAAAHVYGAKSAAIQSLVAMLLRARLGFGEEIVLTPQDGLVTRARPDFFYPLATGRGVIAEVERGGTVTNNHDLKDVWKTHVAPDAQHLFLIVPQANTRADGTVRERPFVRVAHRVGAFFGDARREIDVTSAHVFGY
ncbi:hypothetical protein KV097_05290 [Mumia sp. zg.B17]|uniref:hypothetical protein n=1 Tax=Mumia sp. zg.B17 TaxID=2855446 RepID=UPI001C6E0A8C|nr:hypothetical protein [Mumia sp. zg.B17]MBW9205352.1 hypothetical protein [Mumia sp. zg.B17]